MAKRILVSTLLCALSCGQVAAQMSPEDRATHALHGVMTMYAAGMVCYYNKWSFSREETEAMLQTAKVLGKSLPKKTVDDMWANAQQIMAEGQTNASQERCAAVHQQYAIAKQYLLGAKSEGSEKTPQ